MRAAAHDSREKMKRHLLLVRAFGLAAALLSSADAVAQSSPACGAALGAVTSAEPLRNGVLLHAGRAVEQITALRDDVLRVRLSLTGKLPEDASWAVASATRTESASVQQLNSSEEVGFRTKLGQLTVRRSDLTMTLRDAAGHVVQQQARPVCFQGSSFTLTNVMPENEHYFGLGDKTGPFDRRGQAFTLWNTDAYRFQESTDPLYKSIPFFLAYRAGQATGVLLDNTWRSEFDFGRTSADSYSFGAVDGPIDFYLLLGPTPRDVVEAYGWLTGLPPLPPKWAFGYQQSRFSYTPAQRLLDVAQRLRADRIPADAVFLDIDFQDRNRPFTVNTQAFPDLSGTVQQLKALQFHTVAITDLHIAKAPGQGYTPYDTGIAGDHFVHNPDGTVYTGVVWPGPSVFPDFTQVGSRAWWGTLFTPLVADGIDGFWNDMNEPSIFNTSSRTMPLDVVHRINEPGFATRTATHAEIHNVYGMENARGTYEGLRRLRPDQRPFVITRASYAGGQRYAVTWTGDDSSTWNHLRLSNFMLKNLGLSGFSYASADVGGFAGSPTMDLLTRWLEIAAFVPIDRNHTEKGTGDQEPWVGGPEQEAIRRRFIEERYRLMPYLYTVAEETSRTGLPMLRPLFLDYPEAASDGHPLDIDPGSTGEFLLGHDLLIAPSPYPEEPDAYTVEFPTATWYDYWTGEPIHPAPPKAENPEAKLTGMPVAPQIPLTTQVRPTLASLPVYVRGGAILPVAPLTQSTTETPKGPLTLRVFEGPDCRGSVYFDDGESYAFEHGQSLRMELSCSVEADGLHVQIGPHQGTYPAWWSRLHLEVHREGAVQGVAFSGTKALPTTVAGNAVSVDIQDDGKGQSIVVR